MGFFKVPEPPYIAAGVLGGPFVMYLVTPLRNALTLGTINTSASAMSLYRQVFSQGLRQGWKGGAPMASAAMPGFLVIGPAFHMYKDLVGGSSAAAVGLTAIFESLIFYGAETNNAQVAFNQDAQKRATAQIQKIQNPMIPLGGGLGLHIGRNFLAMSGFRVFSTPCQSMISSVNPNMPPSALAISGDFIANVLVSAASAPLHQLYGWSVTTRVAAIETEPFILAATKFLKNQYLTSSGSISSVAGRDMFLRVAYNASIFTIYGFIERAVVNHWPESLHWEKRA